MFRNSFNFTILVRISEDTIRIVHEMRLCADILSGDLQDTIRILSGEHWLLLAWSPNFRKNMGIRSDTGEEYRETRKPNGYRA
jgi:hypothetical protein